MAKRKKKWVRGYHLFLIGILVLLVLVYASLSVKPLFDTSQYVEADVLDIVDSTIILGHGCTAIIAETSPERAYSIALGLEGRIDMRPNTHDIFAQTLKTFNISLDSVTLDAFNGDFYTASMIMWTPEKMLKLDSKPSDAIAVALRTLTPIYINKTLLSERGEDIC
ncbi:MAG: bifunctional nuclease family protein [Candidatus Aenigmatarchaeota archaeon]